MNELIKYEKNEVTILNDGSTTISQRKLAELCGVDKKSVWNYLKSPLNWDDKQDKNQGFKEGIGEEMAFKVVTYFSIESRAANDTARKTLALIGAAGIRAFNYNQAGYVLEAKPKQIIPNFEDPIEAARAWIAAKEEARDLTLQIEEMSPKVRALQRIIEAEGDMNLRSVAKVLGEQPNKFTEFLRNKRVLFKDGKGVNIPYQPFINQGYFKLKAWEKDGRVGYQAMVTAKGVVFLAKKFKEKT